MYIGVQKEGREEGMIIEPGARGKVAMRVCAPHYSQ